MFRVHELTLFGTPTAAAHHSFPLLHRRRCVGADH